MTRPLVLATNNGDVGGGEVMLLHLADAARELGVEVTVVGPRAPGALVAQASDAGHRTVVLDAVGRRAYLRALRSWDRRERRGLLWCNGLVPAVATAGHHGRVVHLHQLPTHAQQAARRIATRGTEAVLAPSRWLAERVPGAGVLPNWTADIDYSGPRFHEGPIRVGYLGRLTAEKGVDVLGRAATALVDAGHDLTLVLAGEERFGRPGDAHDLARALAPLEARVERPGWVAPAAFLPTLDLVVVPSVQPESFGLVAAEAMAAGLPVVVTDAGALPEVVGPEHPWVARHGDARDLARVLTAALGQPDLEAQTKAARARWEQEFSPGAGRARLAAQLGSLGVR